jgi:hypothetical protein
MSILVLMLILAQWWILGQPLVLAHRLVKILSGDIRRCLLALQYWIDSGGGTLQQSQKIFN